MSMVLKTNVKSILSQCTHVNMLQEPGGVGKTGPCDDFWNQNPGSIVCTGQDNKYVDEYGMTAEVKDFIIKHHNKLRGQMDAANMMELVNEYCNIPNITNSLIWLPQIFELQYGSIYQRQ